MKQLYAVPRTKSGNNLTLEYELVNIAVDRRTTFHKKNQHNIVDPIRLSTAIANNNVTVKGNRLLLASGKDAYKFSMDLHSEKRTQW